MAYEVELTRRAERDRDKAYSWYAVHFSEGFAERWYNGLSAAISRLADKPNSFPKAQESNRFSFDLREMRFGGKRYKHRVLFTIRDEIVQVLHIRHSSRRDLTEEDLLGE
ncbi:MAG: type II toxin-antitoxin system RelE/ParE family toxin [Pirellulales bacterium]